jgi:hypothetical protein
VFFSKKEKKFLEFFLQPDGFLTGGKLWGKMPVETKQEGNDMHILILMGSSRFRAQEAHLGMTKLIRKLLK